MGLYEHLPYANFHELNLDSVMNAIASIPDIVAAEVAKQIGEYTIPDGSITTAKLADGAAATAKIANSNVTTAKLADKAVTSAKINDGAVSSAKLGASAVTNAKIANGAVTSAKLADGNVLTAKIADGAVTYDKLDAAFASVAQPASESISVPSGDSTYTNMSSYTVQETGLYMVAVWVMAYGKANTTAGSIDANVNDTPGANTGFLYAARNVVNVPAYTTATACSFGWSFLRPFSAGDVMYLNLAHTTGQTRNIRAGLRVYRLA